MTTPVDFFEIRSLTDFDNSSAQNELLKKIRERDAIIIELENRIKMIEQPQEANFGKAWNNFFGFKKQTVKTNINSKQNENI